MSTYSFEIWWIPLIVHVVRSSLHPTFWYRAKNILIYVMNSCIQSIIRLLLILGTDHLTWRGGYGFLFRSEIFFRTTQELEYLFFLQNLTLGYMTKTLNHIIFFFLHQNQNIFFSNIGNQNICLEKNHNPPLKLNGRSLNLLLKGSDTLSVDQNIDIFIKVQNFILKSKRFTS
jgi:hypothetical protein